MIKSELKKLLAEIEERASRQRRSSDDKIYLLGDLEKIDELIQEQRCYYCGKKWRRGGNGQGGALCNDCYKDEQP